MWRRLRRLSPPRVIVASFVGVILAGTLLLKLPVASATPEPLDWVDALFTATSAVCVTGLIVVDTPTALSPFGHAIILLLIQLGGLGYMTVTTVFAALIGRRLTLQERLVLHAGLNTLTLQEIGRFALLAFKVSLGFELVGAAVLAWHWWDELTPGRAVYHAIFHAVSAFNNAGFSLFSTSLIEYRGDLLVNAVISGLFISGGLGFVVLADVARRRGPRWSLHTRFVLVSTLLLMVGATLTMYALERGNGATLGPLSAGEAWLTAFFQGVTPRTAGFNTLEIGALREPSLFFMMALMFIGAAPGGTGGGVKVTTFGMTVLALWATVRREAGPVLWHRLLPADLVARAFFVCLIAFLVLNAVAGLLLVIEERGFLPTLFEATSAFGTVGLSVGVPGQPVSLAAVFSDAGKVLLVALMLMGRVGPLTLAVALAGGRRTERVRYPEGKLLIG
ncbi:MAG: TrkH family potassium uptake protein [Vicinamibacteraceae bacterium]